MSDLRETIGLVGVGLLGTALAERLLRAGFDVLGFDLDVQRLEHLQSLGGKAAASLDQVPGRTRRIVLSLPHDGVAGEVIEAMRPMLAEGAIIIDTTTGHPGAMQTLAERLAGQGYEYLDATVAGSSQQARDGNAMLLVGGRKAAFAACRDLLSALAGDVRHVGPPGSGARMKLVVNLALGLNRAVLAETLAFARRMGVDPRQALDILRAGPAYSRVMDTKGEKMLEGDFAPQARLAQHLKDVRLILQAGNDCNASLPLSTLHRQLLELLVEQGFADADNSAILRAFE